MNNDLGAKTNQDKEISDSLNNMEEKINLIVYGHLYTGKTLAITRVLKDLNYSNYRHYAIGYEDLTDQDLKKVKEEIKTKKGTIFEANRHVYNYLKDDGPLVNDLTDSNLFSKFINWLRNSSSSKADSKDLESAKLCEIELGIKDMEAIFDYHINKMQEAKKKEILKIKDSLIDFCSLRYEKNKVVYIPKLLARLVNEYNPIDLENLKDKIENNKRSESYVMECFGVSLVSAGFFKTYGTDILNGVGTVLNSVPLFTVIGSLTFGLTTMVGLLGVTREEKFGKFVKLYRNWNNLPQEKKKIICLMLDEKYKLPPHSSYNFLSHWFSDGTEDEFLKKIKATLTDELIQNIESVVKKIPGLERGLKDNSDEIRTIKEDIEGLEKRLDELESRVDDLEIGVKKASEKGDRALEIIEEFEGALNPELYSPSLEEINEVDKEFVSPSNYSTILEHALERPLIINAVPFGGKDELARKVSIDIKKKHNDCNLYWINISQTNFHSLARAIKEDSIIVISDAFGTLSPTVNDDQLFRNLLSRHEENKKTYVIITTSEGVWEKVKRSFPSLHSFLTDICYIDYLSERDYERDKLISFYFDKLAGTSRNIDSGIMEKLRGYSDIVVRELRLPVMIKIFTERKASRITEAEFNLSDIIKETRELEKSGRGWLVDLADKPEKNLTFYTALFTALFPGLPKYKFIPLFNRLYAEKKIQINGMTLHSIIEQNSEYLYQTGGINFRHSEYLKGVWDEIEEYGSDIMSELIEGVYAAMDYPFCVLQAGFTLSNLSSTFPDEIFNFSKKVCLNSKRRYKSHVASIVLINLFREAESTRIAEEISSLAISLLSSSERFQNDTGIFILKGISMIDFGVAVKILQSMIEKSEGKLPYLIKMFGNSLGDKKQNIQLLKSIEENVEKRKGLSGELNKTLKNTISTLERNIDYKRLTVESQLIPNGNFGDGLKFWEQTDYDTVEYSVSDQDGVHHCVAFEKDEANLGRLYQNISWLISDNVIQPGTRLRIKAALKSEGITTVNEIKERGGLCVGVSYVDESGWTPLLDAYQSEVGHLIGTTDWRYYENEFVLGYKPPIATDLILYIDFNNAKGKGLVRDVTLSIVRGK